MGWLWGNEGTVTEDRIKLARTQDTWKWCKGYGEGLRHIKSRLGHVGKGEKGTGMDGEVREEIGSKRKG